MILFCSIAVIALVTLRSTNAEQLFERGMKIAIEDCVDDWFQRHVEVVTEQNASGQSFQNNCGVAIRNTVDNRSKLNAFRSRSSPMIQMMMIVTTMRLSMR